MSTSIWVINLHCGVRDAKGIQCWTQAPQKQLEIPQKSEQNEPNILELTSLSYVYKWSNIPIYIYIPNIK